MNATINPQELKENLETFCGSDLLFQIPLLKTRFTSGVKYLAETTDCYWMVTDVSVIAKSLMNRSSFITIDFKRFSEQESSTTGYAASITYSDGNNTILEITKYHLTDFPLEKLQLFFVNNTLLLPREY